MRCGDFEGTIDGRLRCANRQQFTSMIVGEVVYEPECYRQCCTGSSSYKPRNTTPAVTLLDCERFATCVAINARKVFNTISGRKAAAFNPANVFQGFEVCQPATHWIKENRANGTTPLRSETPTTYEIETPLAR